jgi:hypothetical protein
MEFWSENSRRRTQLGVVTCRREINIKTDLKETERDDVEWIYLAQVRVQRQAFVNTRINHRFQKQK